MKPFCSVVSRGAAFAIGIAAILFACGNSASASDSQVIIVNGTANHCLPYLSCYRPYEIDIKPGDTVTWINNDNRTHTATAGTPNYGAVGMFDSGPILPGRSYSQFFGTVGKFPYYDKADQWPSGVVVVSNSGPTEAAIGWVNGTLSVSSQGSGEGAKLVMTKQVANSGGTDASPVLFRLRITNDTGFLFYDSLLNGSVPARQSVPVTFTWDKPLPGNYRLNFNAENPARQADENPLFSYDLISVSRAGSSQLQPAIVGNFELNNASAVPEFGQLSYLILILSVFLVIGMSARYRLGHFSPT